MLLTVFFILLSISGFFLFLSYEYDSPVFQIVAFMFFFVLGLVLQSGSVYYENGTNTTTSTLTTELYQYGNNFTGYHWDYDTGTAPNGTQTDAYLFHRNTTVTTNNVEIANYKYITDTWAIWIGRFLSLLAAFGVIVFFFTLKNRIGAKE